MNRSTLSTIVASVGLAAASALTAAAAGGASASAATTPSTTVPGSYIVTLATADVSAIDSLAQSLTAQAGGVLGFTYHSALHGFSVTSVSPAAATALAANPLVAAVQPDYVYRAVDTQSPAGYGLDRIDQRNLPLNNSYTYNSDGSGVHAYDIDTGLRVTHNDFKNPDGSTRASIGTDTVGDGQNGNDCAGHGTHTAGTIGSNTYGVAKKVQLVAVRVLGCDGSGSSAGIIAGVDWVKANAIKPAVANMSLGSMALTHDAAIDSAVTSLISSGVTVAVAAGNGLGNGLYSVDACQTSPADVASAITVSATDSTDTRPIWANTGTCVDLFAPGVDIVSTWYTADNATNPDSGTSMSAPHVAGAAAAYLSRNPSATPAQVASALTGNATPGVVKSPGSGSPNKLLYTSFITGGAPGNAAPVANFSSSCSSLTCTFTDASTDSDGTIASRSWSFGDGSTSTATSPSHTYASAGTYTVTLTVTDDKGATGTKSATVTAGTVSDPDPSTPTLTSGTSVSGAAAAANGFKYYKILVPAGKTSLASVLSFTTSCGLLSCTPDLDLYVQKSAKPTTSAYACSATTSSAPEQCTVSNPAATWYYVGVYTYSGSAGSAFSIKSTF